MRRFILGLGFLLFITSCQPKLPNDVQRTVDTINVLSNKLYILDSVIHNTEPTNLAVNELDSFVSITLKDYRINKQLISKNKELSDMMQNEPQLVDYDEVRNCGEKRYPIKDRIEIQEKAFQAMQISLDNRSREAEE